MRPHRFWIASTAIVAVFALQSSHAFAQFLQKVTSAKDDPLVGVWKIDVQNSKYERGGPTRPAGTANPKLYWVFTPQKNGGLRMSVYPEGYPASMPGRSYLFNWDGKEAPDPQGPGMHETVIFNRMDKNLLTRLVLRFKSDEDRAAHKNPSRQEWVSYAISADGKKLAINSWDETTPQFTNRQIFDKTNDSLPDDSTWPATLGSR